MSLEWQKILIRAVLVFTIVFGVIFFVLERNAPKYEGRSIFVVPAKSDVMAEQLDITVQNITAILSSDAFRSDVADAMYAQTETFPKFTLEVENPAGSVFVLSYADTSIDPFAVREAIGVVRVSAIKTIAKSYDLSRDLSIQFLDEGEVIESHKSFGNMVIAFVAGLLSTLSVEGGVLWRNMRESEYAFRSAIEKRLAEQKSSSEWWKNFEAKREVSENRPGEGEQNIFQEKEPITIPDTTPAQVVMKEQQVPFPEERELRSSATAPAPANLPIAVEVPEAIRPYVSPELAEVLPEEDEMLEDEVMVSSAPVSAYDTPTVNPEPSVEELKARLNKLLRGEL